MDEKVRSDLMDSAYDFKRVVWPRVQDWIGGGELIPVESVTESVFANQLDILAGIDAWQISQDRGIRGLASRVQWGIGYESFTIRTRRMSGAETELSKRQKSFDGQDGRLFPYWTIQGYVTEKRRGGLIYACMIQTKDLYDFIKLRPEKISHRVNPDGNLFDAIWVPDLRTEGYLVHFENSMPELLKTKNWKSGA